MAAPRYGGFSDEPNRDLGFQNLYLHQPVLAKRRTGCHQVHHRVGQPRTGGHLHRSVHGDHPCPYSQPLQVAVGRPRVATRHQESLRQAPSPPVVQERGRPREAHAATTHPQVVNPPMGLSGLIEDIAADEAVVGDVPRHVRRDIVRFDQEVPQVAPIRLVNQPAEIGAGRGYGQASTCQVSPNFGEHAAVRESHGPQPGPTPSIQFLAKKEFYAIMPKSSMAQTEEVDVVPVTAVVGVNWGDEGKGRVVDYLAQDADVVVRYQGGANAGHTVVNQYGLHRLHLLPSGVFNPSVLNVLGPGMVVDLEALGAELREIREHGVPEPQLLVSDRATIVFPFHRELDALEEERLGSHRQGSTRRGIAPAYGDRYLKKAVQVGELLYPEHLRRHLEMVAEWANLLLVRVYGQKGITAAGLWEWVSCHGDQVKHLIGDAGAALAEAVAAGRRVLFEGQIGALRDVHYGMYPYVTSSCCLSSYVHVGGALLGARVDRVVGVMKAYSTVIGEGPFVTELEDETGTRLRERGREFGAATGRPRRTGWFDAVGSRYGARVQSVDEIVLTKLDVLSGEERLGICVAYEIDGSMVDGFPMLPLLERAHPVYEWMPGWEEDISGVRSYGDLPLPARRYVERLEELVGCPIRSISVGPERHSMIVR